MVARFVAMAAIVIKHIVTHLLKNVAMIPEHGVEWLFLILARSNIPIQYPLQGPWTALPAQPSIWK
jgi:hypothetical protein